jgi:hypothetical protein
MVHFCGDMVDDYDDVGVSIFYSVAAFNTLVCNRMFLRHTYHTKCGTYKASKFSGIIVR